MSYRVDASPNFSQKFKRLARKFPSLKLELELLIEQLENDPSEGAARLKYSCFKHRIAITSKGKGKRGGGRAIVHLHVSASVVTLLTLYDKSEREDVADNELKQMIDAAGIKTY